MVRVARTVVAASRTLVRSTGEPDRVPAGDATPQTGGHATDMAPGAAGDDGGDHRHRPLQPVPGGGRLEPVGRIGLLAGRVAPAGGPGPVPGAGLGGRLRRVPIRPLVRLAGRPLDLPAGAGGGGAVVGGAAGGVGAGALPAGTDAGLAAGGALRADPGGHQRGGQCASADRGGAGLGRGSPRWPAGDRGGCLAEDLPAAVRARLRRAPAVGAVRRRPWR